MSYAYHCEVCDGAHPTWSITRHGDAVISWACDHHLSTVCERLQRDFEVTELSVVHRPKQVGHRFGLRKETTYGVADLPHAKDCHCNGCIGWPNSPFPSELIKYADIPVVDATADYASHNID